MNPMRANRPGGRCHASERDISCCDHSGDCVYHGLVNLDVAQGQGCHGGNPTAGFEQLNAAALGRVVRPVQARGAGLDDSTRPTFPLR